MQKFFACLSAILLLTRFASAQNVGIGTNSPLRKLSVNGSIMIDQGNKNPGGLDSAALVFGNSGEVGIASRKTPGIGFHGLGFWTGGQENVIISAAGNVGIGGTYATTQRLQVHGNSNFLGNLTANSLSAVTRMGVGGPDVGAYRLYLHNGHSFFQGNISMSGNNTVNGHHIVGGNSTLYGDLTVNGDINASTINGTGTAHIWLHNQNGYNGILKGTIYLTTIAKN